MRTVVRHPLICRGSPTVSGTRLTVFNVTSRTAAEGVAITSADMDLSGDEISLCLDYCANLNCVQENTDLPFCDGCELSNIPRHQIAAKSEEFIRSGDPLTIGINRPPADYVEAIELTWLIAAEQIEKGKRGPPSMDLS